jgi:[ribosomal protein S5]-alanine N-acetyltransferase
MIETQRLKLIPCEEKYLEAFIRDEKEMADLLGVNLADNWLLFPESIAYTLNFLKSNAGVSSRWGMYFFILKDENLLIGNGGYKGAPDDQGMVEIGYSIAPSHQNRGLATEAALGMINDALSFENVQAVDAHTLAEQNASTRVLRKCGMEKTGEKFGTEDGDIWHWRVRRKDFENLRKNL